MRRNLVFCFGLVIEIYSYSALLGKLGVSQKISQGSRLNSSYRFIEFNLVARSVNYLNKIKQEERMVRKGIFNKNE